VRGAAEFDDARQNFAGDEPAEGAAAVIGASVVPSNRRPDNWLRRR